MDKFRYAKEQDRLYECGLETSFLHMCNLARAEPDPMKRQRKYNDALAIGKIIKQDSTPELLLAVAECYYNQRSYINTLDVLSKGTRKGWAFAEHCELRGRCLFKMEEYETAIAAFREATELGGNPRDNKTWIMRCHARYAMKNDRTGSAMILMDSVPAHEELAHDWYQTSTYVSLVVYAEGLKEDQVKAEFTEKSVDVVIDAKEPTRLHFDLEREINPADTRVTIGRTKVEVRMAKAVPSKQGWKFGD